MLQAGDLAGVGAVAALELEVLRIASSSSPMAPQTLATQAAIYSRGEASARTVRFLPARLAR